MVRTPASETGSTALSFVMAVVDPQFVETVPAEAATTTLSLARAITPAIVTDSPTEKGTSALSLVSAIVGAGINRQPAAETGTTRLALTVAHTP